MSETSSTGLRAMAQALKEAYAVAGQAATEELRREADQMREEMRAEAEQHSLRLKAEAMVARAQIAMQALSGVFDAVAAQRGAVVAQLEGASGPKRAMLERHLAVIQAQEEALLAQCGVAPEVAQKAVELLAAPEAVAPPAPGPGEVAVKPHKRRKAGAPVNGTGHG